MITIRKAGVPTLFDHTYKAISQTQWGILFFSSANSFQKFPFPFLFVHFQILINDKLKDIAVTKILLNLKMITFLKKKY